MNFCCDCNFSEPDYIDDPILQPFGDSAYACVLRYICPMCVEARGIFTEFKN